MFELTIFRDALKVIDQEGVMNAGVGVFIANTTKPDRTVFCSGAGEFDGLNAGQAFSFGHRSALDDTVLRVRF